MIEHDLGTVTVSQENYDYIIDFNLKFPSKYFYRNGLGDYIFLQTGDRAKAEKYMKYHINNFYSLRVAYNGNGSGDYTAKGTATRKGQKKYN